MLIKHFTSIILVLFIAFPCIGQDWFKGTVVLHNQNAIRGEISYWAGRDAIFLKSGDASMVFTAFKVKHFTLFDHVAGIERKFISKVDSVGAAVVYKFYEVIVDGEISVLRQQHTFWYSLHKETIDYNYFVVLEDQIVTMSKFRRHFLNELKRSSETLNSFAHKNNITRYSTNDAIRFITYYNEMQSGVASLR